MRSDSISITLHISISVTLYITEKENILSMGIVGVKSTIGREVKFIDPTKTTRSESA